MKTGKEKFDGDLGNMLRSFYSFRKFLASFSVHIFNWGDFRGQLSIDVSRLTMNEREQWDSCKCNDSNGTLQIQARAALFQDTNQLFLLICACICDSSGSEKGSKNDWFIHFSIILEGKISLELSLILIWIQIKWVF